jgi:hypothetical protein
MLSSAKEEWFMLEATFSSEDARRCISADSLLLKKASHQWTFDDFFLANDVFVLALDVLGEADEDEDPM